MARKLLEQLRRWADAEDKAIERERQRRVKRLVRQRKRRRLTFRLLEKMKEGEE